MTILEKIKKIEKPRLSVVFLVLSFFSIFFNPGKYHSLLYSVPFYFLFCATEYIIYFKSYRKIRGVKLDLFQLLLCAFAFVTVLSCAFVETSFNSLKVTLYYIAAVVSAVVILNSKLEKKDIKFIINSYIASVVLIVITMLCQRVVRSGDAFRYSIASFLNGVVKDSNFLAAYMSVPVVILAIRALFANKNRILNTVFCVVCFAGVFATGSRAALLFLAMSLVIIVAYYIYCNRSRKLMRRLIISAIAIVLIVLIAIPFVPDALINRYFKDSIVDASNITRLDVWKTGLNIFVHHPLTGLGVESQYRMGINYGMTYQWYTHSTYVDLLADYGIWGLFTLGLFLVLLGVKNLKPKNWLILAIAVNFLGTAAILSALYVAYFWQNIILVLLLMKYAKDNPDAPFAVLDIEPCPKQPTVSTENKVSVIMPVYNSEATVGDAIKSVIGQTYGNIELIVINDGSRDGTADVCRELASQYPQIKYIEIENSGVSSARNRALAEATGDYIAFVDSDDSFNPDHIAVLMDAVIKNNADIAAAGFKAFGNDNYAVYAAQNKVYTDCGDYIGDLQDLTLFNQLWQKVYRADIIKKNNITFDKDLDLGEDYMFTLEYMRHVGVSVLVSDVVYRYRVTSDGLNYRYRPDKFDLEYALLKKLEQFYVEGGYDMQRVYNQYAKIYFNGIDYILANKRISLSARLKELDKFTSLPQYKNDLEQLQTVINSRKYKFSIKNMLGGRLKIFMLVVLFKIKKEL